MKAMILAAGRGERMRPLTDHTPKPLLKIAGESLIGWHLRRLKQAGFTDIVINHAWLGQKIENELGNGSRYGLNIEYSAEKNGGLETAGGIATALPLLGSDPFLVINGDILCDMDFGTAAQTADQLLQNKQLAHLWLTDNPPHHPQGDFTLTSDGLVSATPSQTMLTFCGIGVYHPDLFQHTEPNQAAKLAPLLKEAMAQEKISGQKFEGLWMDVGTVERLKAADEIASSWVQNPNN